MEVIARIRNDFPTKFGLPRQSGLAPSLLSRIVFEPKYRNPDALRGIEGFSHLWIVWQFSGFAGKPWSPMVRPPRLGGNERVGVFATRSPHRPNPLGLSCVRLDKVDFDPVFGPVLLVSGADMCDGTPIYDIKPYLPGVDSHPEATDGFVGSHPQRLLDVVIPGDIETVLREVLDPAQMRTLAEILAQDPRPAFHDDPEREYGISYAGLDIHFKVRGSTLSLIRKTPLRMAVLNLTPDSFWEPSRYNMAVLSSGADIVDIGAVSSRPGADPVSEEEEWARLEPVLRSLPEGLRISIDTVRSSIVRRAHELVGHFIVNDISAGEDDSAMLSTVAELGLGYIAMHKRGTPQTMDSLTDYPEGVVGAVLDYFEAFSQKAAEAGVKDWILDPGFGFAKTESQSLELLRHLGEFKRFGKSVLAGIADKRFTAGRTPLLEDLALLCGADILRIHI